MGTNALDSNRPRSCSVIIPVFGPKSYLDACFNALRWTASSYHLILVDNATGYDMRGAPNLDALIRNGINEGFAKACNAGAGCSSADVLVFLNVDTEPEFDWLVELIGAFDDPEVGMAGSKLVYPNGQIQHAGISISQGATVRARNITIEQPAGDIDGVTGACLAIRRSVFEEVDGFDEGYWNGNEDVDLCLKVTAAGYRIRYVPESIVMHHESATGPERWVKCSENVARLNKKWRREPAWSTR